MSVIVSEPTVSQQYEFVVGVDTHAATHTFALLAAATGACLAHAEFPTSPAGLARAQSWLQQRVGEHATQIRTLVAERMAWLGVVVDPHAVGEEVTGEGARVRSFVVHAREDLQMAAEAARLIGC